MFTLDVSGSESTKSTRESYTKQVENYINENNLDLSKRLPHGTREVIAKKLNMNPSKVMLALRYIRTTTGTVTDLKRGSSKYEHIIKYIKENNIDLSKRLKYGAVEAIASELMLPKLNVKYCISILRKRKHFLADPIKHHSVEKSRTPEVIFSSNMINDVCREAKLTRDNPNAEKEACDGIIKCLKSIPGGGAGMIIGTPTAFCVSDSSKNNMLLTDNLKVAIALELTTDIVPMLIIGTGVDKLKANIKQHHWKNNNATSAYTTILDVVDRDSFTHHVSIFANKHPFAKVILMTSGCWIGSNKTNKKWGLELNFKTPSEYLSTKFPNLHIIAMTTVNIDKRAGGHFRYKIHHLHRGKTTQY
jgi:hypothetical protein